GTKWHTWISGKEPTISPRLAQIMWETLTQAEMIFMNPSREWNPPKKYLSDRGRKRAVSNIEKDMNLIVGKLQNLTLQANELLDPYDLYCAHTKEKELNKNWIQTMAAYSILCHDLSISGLLEKEANVAALGYAYATTALSVCREQMNQILPSSKLHAVVRSDIGRKGAYKQHEKSTYVLRDKVIDYCTSN